MRKIIIFWLLFLPPLAAFCVDYKDYISHVYDAKHFPIVTINKTLPNERIAAPINFSETDFSGVKRAAADLQSDIEKVSSIKPAFSEEGKLSDQNIIIIGTVGKNPLIDQLVQNKKLDVKSIEGKWETFLLVTIENPFSNVKKALVIVGSDKRGTIFGIYDLCAHIGVSPWYFWADVPVKKQTELYVKSGSYSEGEPKVKYRGIFLNDEAPCLSGWTKEKNGGFNQKLYTKVFELILRLKGNYLWPAMWGNAFHADDPMNPILADDYGVVIGTSHHEPLMRAHDEWRRYVSGELALENGQKFSAAQRSAPNGKKWDYTTNDSTLREYWRSSVKARYKFDNIFSVGMRGDGDEPMTRETATALLEKIVTDQRQIIEEVSGKPASEKPQLWALYKEVQDYYDKGMRVPDDITLLLCDDNWGNIRKLPDLEAKERRGGYGIYYHFDYVGDPRNYKWINTNSIPRVWEQMHLAYEYKARDIWIVNVGDLKPMEFPISFFLDYAWNPDNIPLEKLPDYSKRWAESVFGNTYAKEIAYFLDTYTLYNSRVKPELLSEKTYSLENYNEFERVVTDYNTLASKAQIIYNKIAPEYKDTYYQLVLYPILACANLNDMYYNVALNHKYAKLVDSSSLLVDGVKNATTDDQRSTLNYQLIANQSADLAESCYKKDSLLSHYFNTQLAGGKWNHFADQTHIGYTYWQQPKENSMPKVIHFSIEPNSKTIVSPKAISKLKPESEKTEMVRVPLGYKGFVEDSGYVSMQAETVVKNKNTSGFDWKIIQRVGKTGSGVTIFPVTMPTHKLDATCPVLEFNVFLQHARQVQAQVMLSPTLAFNGNKGLKYAISIDGEAPQVIDMHADKSVKAWGQSVANNVKIITTPLNIQSIGNHTLKFWMMDAGVILQKIVIDLGGLKPSYLGPPESRFIK